MNKDDFGAFVSQLRREKNLTQETLAFRLHVTNKAVSKWECGLGYPDITLLEPLAGELGVSVIDLLNSKRTHEPLSFGEANDAVLEIIGQSKKSVRNFKKRIYQKTTLALGIIGLLAELAVLVIHIIMASAAVIPGMHVSLTVLLATWFAAGVAGIVFARRGRYWPGVLLILSGIACFVMGTLVFPSRQFWEGSDFAVMNALGVVGLIFLSTAAILSFPVEGERV